MGNPNAQPSDPTPTSHFSHPHPLQLSNLAPLGQIPHCSACKLDASGSVYTCTPCNFILHPKCYQLPQLIKHPFDQNHPLSLQPKPVYPEGLFRCDACGNHGDGFSYHCSPCGIDLHTTCALLPMQFAHHCHRHQLSLTFSAPYAGNQFSCDACKRVGSKTWIYRCNGCQFDVHLTCVATVVPDAALIRQQPPQNTWTTSAPPQPHSLINPSNIGPNPGAPVRPPVVTGQPQSPFVANPSPAGLAYNNLNQPAGVAARPVNNGRLMNGVMTAAIDGVASGLAQATAQALFQGFSGGGGGGGAVSDVDAIGGGADVGATTDGGSYYDGGYGGMDIGDYGGGDVSSY